MAAARERAARILPADVELLAGETPQYVNEDGYEVDAQTFAQALQGAAKDLATPLHGLSSPGTPVDGDAIVDVLTGEEDPAVASDELNKVAADAESLLSLAESNVLHYSVVAARQHHLQHLLPHVFSHPPIPANARPRARPPPKGTFLYPTPPPLVHPLPHREYHAPIGNKKKTTEDVSPAPDGVEVGESKRRKYGRNKGKSKADESEAPAHEIECIARVTLSIGPIAFPDTEIWVGRFVQPRAPAPKAPRAKKAPGDRKKASEGAQTTHGRFANPSHYPQSGHVGSMMRPSAGPPYTGYRPRPPAPPSAHAGPARPPPAPRAELSPDLIKRVNEAATQHSWLSQIIHKAARSQATKEELAKLGRVVNRLKEGKDVGEGAEDGIVSISSQPGPSRPPTHPPPQATSSTATPAASGGHAQVDQAGMDADSPGSGSLTPVPGDDSDNDSDIDMKGPQQVGGGYPDSVDPDADTSDSRSSVPTPMAPSQQPGASSSWISKHPSHNQNSGPSQSAPNAPHPPYDSSSFDSPPPPTGQSTHVRAGATYQPNPETYAAYGIAPPSTGSGLAPPYAAAGTAPSSFGHGMPPPPRPTYHLPPPFLLIAFKEAPTEKFQLPLGSLSYISRVGENEETVDSTPIPSAPPATAVVTPLSAEAIPTPMRSTIAARKPTRASLSKEKPPSPTPLKAEESEPEPITAPQDKNQSLPDLLRLSGASPPSGTVLISTFVPRTKWVKPDWEELAARLPFGNPFFERSTFKATEVKAEPSPEPSSSNVASATGSPRRNLDKARTASEAPVKPELSSDSLPVKGKLLNLATESFFPADGDVQAVTIRLSNVTDQIWQRLKTINGMATTADMKSLGEHSPHLMPKVDTPPPTIPTPANLPPRIPPFQPSPALRTEYATRKKTFFRSMLTRVPTRKFLRYRLPDYRHDLVEATTDKWGPRPYPISTKALYNRDGEYDGQPIQLSPVTPKKGNKRAVEPDVTFELPVSLDQLDEMVAENALKGKKGKGMDGRKRTGKRWVAGTVCEGCGRGDKRVWRSGPGGPRTLCNGCGDKSSANELGPLVAPGAAHPNKDTASQDQANDDGPVTSGTQTTPSVLAGVDTEMKTASRDLIRGRSFPDVTPQISTADHGSAAPVQPQNPIALAQPSAQVGAPIVVVVRPQEGSGVPRASQVGTTSTIDAGTDVTNLESSVTILSDQPSGGPSTSESATS